MTPTDKARDTDHELSTLRAALGRAHEALRPFVEYGNSAIPYNAEDDYRAVVGDDDETEITAGHVRAAEAILADPTGQVAAAEWERLRGIERAARDWNQQRIWASGDCGRSTPPDQHDYRHSIEALILALRTPPAPPTEPAE